MQDEESQEENIDEFMLQLGMDVRSKKEKYNDYRREWRSNNRDKVKSTAKKGYNKHRQYNIDRVKKYKELNLDKIKATYKKYTVKNKSKILIKIKNWKKLNKDRVKIHQHNKHLKQKYGITRTKFLELCALQSNKCAICGSDNKGRSLCVDHNHNTKKIREMLCTSCNAGLGNFKENIKIIQKALDYINKHKAMEK